MSSTSPTAQPSPTRGYAAPRSRTKGYARLDQRTRQAILLRKSRAELVAHLGGEGAMSPTQAALVEQVGQLRLRLAEMDRRHAEAGEMSTHDSAVYLAWANSLTRTLVALGLKSVKVRTKSLTELLSEPAPTESAAD